MSAPLDAKNRYVQVAFNHDLALAQRVLPTLTALASSDRVLVEAGTPFVKREGLRGIRGIRQLWQGRIVADLKTVDGALGEVALAAQAGANAVTAMGNAPTETLDLFVAACARLRLISMVDMLGVDDPLTVLRPLSQPPDVVVIHRGRDEESSRDKVIQYRHVNRIRSKFDVLISAAGGVDLREARSAIFNGANIVVVNLVAPGDRWNGISVEGAIKDLVQEFLTTIE